MVKKKPTGEKKDYPIRPPHRGLKKGALLFGIVVKASGSQNQCHIMAEVDENVTSNSIVDKIQLFIKNQLV